MKDGVKRESGLDFFRIIAAFFVISLHVGSYKSFNSEELAAAIRLGARWAVPFFFMLSGYFLATKAGTMRSIGSLIKLVLLFVISSVVLIPLVIAQSGIVSGIRVFLQSDVLIKGSYFHLWYLSSAAVGMLILLVMENRGLEKVIPIIALGSLVLYLFVDAYKPASYSGTRVARHFSSFGFIYVGMLMRMLNPSWQRGILLIVLGLVMQEIEAHILNYAFGKSILEFQFLLGTLVLSIGFFEIARSCNKLIPEGLSKVGANHTLLVYVFHPYGIAVFARLCHVMSLPRYYIDVFVVPVVFFMTLIGSIVLLKICPVVHEVLNGNLNSLAFIKSVEH